MSTNILLVTDGWIHPPVAARFWLSYILTQPGSGYQFKRVRTLDGILKMDLSSFQALVLYFHHKRISEAALKIFEEYVVNGGGVLAIHSATASFKKQDHYTDIIGGKFAGHGPIEKFEINPVIATKKIFAGIPAFSINDELYIHDLQPDIETHFTALFNGEQVPMVWTRRHGDGRICYACPGHRSATLRVPAVQGILTKGLAWVCQREA
jgi:uncharacterized protein